MKAKRKELLRKIDQSTSERALFATGLIVLANICSSMAYLTTHETQQFVNKNGNINVSELMARSLTLALSRLQQTLNSERKNKTKS